MKTTVLGLFDELDDARSVLEELADSPLDLDAIEVIHGDVEVQRSLATAIGLPARRGVPVGMAGGAVAGAMAGWLVGGGILAELGPLLSMAGGTILGTLGGGVLGGLSDTVRVPEIHQQELDAALAEGATALIVRTDNLPTARAIGELFQVAGSRELSSLPGTDESPDSSPGQATPRSRAPGRPAGTPSWPAAGDAHDDGDGEPDSLFAPPWRRGAGAQAAVRPPTDSETAGPEPAEVPTTAAHEEALGERSTAHREPPSARAEPAVEQVRPAGGGSGTHAEDEGSSRRGQPSAPAAGAASQSSGDRHRGDARDADKGRGDEHGGDEHGGDEHGGDAHDDGSRDDDARGTDVGRAGAPPAVSRSQQRPWSDDTPVTELGLGPRFASALERAGVSTLAQLRELSADDGQALRELPGIGPVAVGVINSRLSAHGPERPSDASQARARPVATGSTRRRASRPAPIRPDRQAVATLLLEAVRGAIAQQQVQDGGDGDG